MDYHNKYLKYKNKYLQLKSNMNQKGGCLQADLNTELQRQKQLIEDEKAARLLAEQPATEERERIQSQIDLLIPDVGGDHQLTEANINWLRTFNPSDYKGIPINASIPGLDGDTHIRADLQILIQYFSTLTDFKIRRHLFGPDGPKPGPQSGILCPFHFKIMQENSYNISSAHNLNNTNGISVKDIEHSTFGPNLKIKVSDYMCAILFCPELSVQEPPEQDNYNILARYKEVIKQLSQNPNISK